MQEKGDYLGTGAGNGAQAGGGGGSSRRGKDVLVVGFDARNHGHRLTDELAQKGWGVGNEQHAIDLYGMILGASSNRMTQREPLTLTATAHLSSLFPFLPVRRLPMYHTSSPSSPPTSSRKTTASSASTASRASPSEATRSGTFSRTTRA